MIIDCHAHTFPFLGSSAGYSSVEERMRYLQLGMIGHPQGARRLRDHSSVNEETLADLPPEGPPKLRDVGFHIEENGRFAWRHGKEDLYMHFMPPSLQSNASPPEFLLAEMACAGVEVAVLQNASLYGRLNEYFAAATARYPGRFIGLAKVDEPNADSEAALRGLKAAVLELNLKGICYENRAFYFDSYRHSFDHPRYEVFWETVRQLQIPVFWDIRGVPQDTPQNYLNEMARLNRWADRYPDVPSIITHGISPTFLEGNLPEPLEKLLGREHFWVEVLYPIHWGRTHDYPYPELRPVLQRLYQRAGGHRLIWGSDMPNVQRNCTYRQSMDYLRRHCDFISPSDMNRILGSNVANLFGLK